MSLIDSSRRLSQAVSGTKKSTHLETAEDHLRARVRNEAFAIQGLSKEEADYYAEAFLCFDLEKKGKISSRDLRKVMESLELKPTEDEIEQMINVLDEDSDFLIGPEEFFKLIYSLQARQNLLETEQDMRDAFRMVDTESQGYITAKDLSQFYASLGERISMEQAQDMIRMVDTDLDGRIDFQDFKAVCKIP